MASSMRIWSDRVLLQQLMTVQLILAMVNGHFTPNGPNDCPPGMPTLPSYSVQQFVSMGPSSPGQYPPSMMGAPSQMMPPSSTMGSPSQSSPSYPQQQQQQPDLAGSNPIGQIGRQVHQFVLESGASGTTMTVANGVVIRGDQAAAASNIVMLPSSTIPGTGGSSMTPGMSPSYLNPSPSMLNRGAAPSSSYSNMIGSPSPIPSNTESSIPMSMVSMSSSPTSGSASTLPVPSFSTSSPSSQSGPGMNFSSPGNTTMSAGANSTTPASKSSIPNWLIDNQWRPSDSDWSSDWPLPGNQTDNGLSSNSSTPPKPESIPIRNDDMFPSDGNQNRSEAGIKNDLKISDLVSSLMNDGSKRSIPYAQASNQTSTANPGSISQMIKQLIPNGNNSTNSPVNASGRDDNVSNDFGANTTNNTLSNSIDQGAGKSSNGSISGLLNWLQDSNNANKPIQNGSKRTVTELVRWLMDEPNSTSSQAEQAANGNGSGSAGSDSIGSSNGNGSVNSGSYNGNGSGNDVGSSSSGSSIPNTIGGNDISNSGSDSSSLSTPTFRPRPDVSGPQSGASSDSSGPRGTISDIIRSLKI